MCNGIKSNGQPCGRKGEWCYQHIGQKPVEAEIVIEEKPIDIESETESSDVESIENTKNAEANLDINVVSTEMPPQQTKIDDAKETLPILVESKSAKVNNYNLYDFVDSAVATDKLLNRHQRDTMQHRYLADKHSVGLTILTNDEFDNIDLDSISSEKVVDIKYYFVESEEVIDMAIESDQVYCEKLLCVIFDSADERKRYKQLSKNTIPELELSYHAKLYDESLFDLCILLSTSWIADSKNKWQLARMIYEMAADPQMMRCTYAMVLAKLQGEYYHQGAALFQYDKDGPSATVKFPTSPLSLSKLKQIAGGNNSDGYDQWKNKYDPDMAKPKLNTSQQLRLKLVEAVGDTYRREKGTGAIYERKTDYYYVRKYNDPMDFLNHIFADDDLYCMSSKKDSDELVSFIKTKAHPKFKWIELDYNYIGFKNGINDLATAQFIPTADAPKGIQVRKYFDLDGDINKATPMFDKYLSFQFEKAEDRDIICFAVGRCLTTIDDRFDFMVMLNGQGGSGKSLLQNLIKHSFGGAQVGYLSNSFQDRFGLSEFANKQIVCCDDMPRNLAKTLPRSDFLSMMTRGAISCPVKGKASIEVSDWNLPTMINSNHMPNYKDEAGEIVRRMLMVRFGKQVPDDQVDVSLEDKLKTKEYAAILHRCRAKYLEFKQKYSGQKLTTFLTETFLEQTNELREALNNSYAFAAASCEYESGTEILASDLRRVMLKWMKQRFSLEKMPKESLNSQEILRIDDRFKFIEMKVCRHCRQHHIKGCCDNYNSRDRSSVRKFVNMKVRAEICEQLNEYPETFASAQDTD